MQCLSRSRLKSFAGHFFFVDTALRVSELAVCSDRSSIEPFRLSWQTIAATSDHVIQGAFCETIPVTQSNLRIRDFKTHQPVRSSARSRAWQRGRTTLAASGAVCKCQHPTAGAPLLEATPPPHQSFVGVNPGNARGFVPPGDPGWCRQSFRVEGCLHTLPRW